MFTAVFLFVAFALLVWITISIQRASRDERDESRGWRTRWASGALRYEEKLGDRWEGIEIETVGRSYATTGIRFRSCEHWRQYPAWASNRRDEIVARVTEDFRDSSLRLTEEQNQAPDRTSPSVTAPAVQESRP